MNAAANPWAHEDPPPRQPNASLNVWDAGEDDGAIPPRQWLLGTVFCRGYLSSIIAAGATGKTAVRIAQALSLTTGRSLTDEYVFKRVRVLLISLEDDRDELRRRVRAALAHFGLDRSAIAGWLFLSAGAGLKLATVEDGAVVEGPLVALIRAEVKLRGIDLVSIDPMVKAHGVNENDNAQIDAVVTMLTKLAIDLNIAIDVPHHISKGPSDPGNADRGRGASSFKDAGRLVYSLNQMSTEEAATFGIPETERRSLIRMDAAKVNIAPAAASAKWFKLQSVSIDNGDADYPNGDNLQVAEPWAPPDLWAKISSTVANTILDEIDRGIDGGARYTNAPAADRAAWPVVQNHVPGLTEKQCKAVISAWVKSGLLALALYHNPKRRADEQGFSVNPGKRPS